MVAIDVTVPGLIPNRFSTTQTSCMHHPVEPKWQLCIS